jgi:hypothetical protein
MIDVLLKEQGWVVSDRSRVQAEVDTRQSDFVAKNYKTVSETLKNDMESKYVDYLLLDSFGAPLAIVEARRTSRDPHLGQKQAEMYADDIKRQTGKDVFIFLSNGYRIIFWDRERYSPRDVKGFHFGETCMAALLAANIAVPAGFWFATRTALPLAFIGASVLFLPLFVFLPRLIRSAMNVDTDAVLDAFGKNEQVKKVFWAFFAATAGLVLAQVLDPVTAQQIIAVITGMGA